MPLTRSNFDNASVAAAANPSRWVYRHGSHTPCTLRANADDMQVQSRTPMLVGFHPPDSIDVVLSRSGCKGVIKQKDMRRPTLGRYF